MVSHRIGRIGAALCAALTFLFVVLVACNRAGTGDGTSTPTDTSPTSGTLTTADTPTTVDTATTAGTPTLTVKTTISSKTRPVNTIPSASDKSGVRLTETTPPDQASTIVIPPVDPPTDSSTSPSQGITCGMPGVYCSTIPQTPTSPRPLPSPSSTSPSPGR
jgi:hypothetical protein